MSAPKWAPGPWRILEGWHEFGTPIEIVADDAHVCKMNTHRMRNGRLGCGTERPINNAHLVAAAPDLYAALDECLQAIDLCTPDAPDPLPDSVIGKARTALRKARGEQARAPAAEVIGD